jgi:LytS/YehU family sensor histidine kinase
LLGLLVIAVLVAFFLYRTNRQNRRLEVQHLRQLETEFEQKLADTEMTTLRAQMNPHFIFNCLNSIKLYTLQHNADKASDYLTKFARLIRLVLENSRSERVTLQNELEALQLYIELEAMRFKQKVQFLIQVSPDIDQQFVQIPPLLLQPYVENAIWHGLMHKAEGGYVRVDVCQSGDHWLHVEITDDGIGRERARELKSKSAGLHKSFGMQVTADRIRLINQLYQIQTQAQVVDLVAPDGEPLGTKVVLDIPV